MLTSSIDCDLIEDCFNCTVSNDCIWKDSQCYSTNETFYTNYWWEEFKVCNDVSSNETINKYCGTTEYSLNQKDTLIELPNINDTFSLQNLHCKYTLSNINKKDIININSSISIDNDSFQLEILTKFRDDTSTYKKINTYDYSVTYEKVSSIIIYFYSQKQYSINPFTIVFNKESQIQMKGLLTSIIVIVSLILISLVVFLLLRKKIIENIRRRVLRNMNNQNNAAVPIENKATIKNNTKIINNLLINELFPKKYDDELSKQSKDGKACSICLENFKVDDKVSLTQCLHLFHFQCLSTWLHKNILNPKCPNCNYNFVQVKEDKPNTEIIHINRPMNNLNNSSLLSNSTNLDNTRSLLFLNTTLNRTNQNRAIHLNNP